MSRDPVTDRLIAPDARKHVRFDAFFENVMFHEVAHGLGVKNTLDGKGTVTQALKERLLQAGPQYILGAGCEVVRDTPPGGGMPSRRSSDRSMIE